MKSFKEFLSTLIVEGGNVAFGDKQAERIDLSKVSREDLVPKLKKLLFTISKEYKDLYSIELWNKKLLDSGKFLSGSAFHLFDVSTINSVDFMKKKSTVGDIDLQVDKLQKDQIENFLKTIKGKKVNIGTLYDFKYVMGQFITLWEVEVSKDLTLNIQLDFELVEYSGGAPTEWANFSHSSHWSDISKNVKGAFHKLLLRAVTDKEALTFVEVMKSKEKVVSSNLLSFSVENGLRSKYVPVLDENGVQAKNADGLLKFKKLDTKDSTYETNLANLIKILFEIQKDPSEKDLDNFKSFTGLVTMIKKYCSPSQQENIVSRFIELLFGVGSQGLYKGDPAKDKEEKIVAVTIILKTFDKDISSFQDKINSYYENYK